MKSAIFMINICNYNHHFEVFVTRKNKGIRDLECGEVGGTN
jgi:hypothetical protein